MGSRTRRRLWVKRRHRPGTGPRLSTPRNGHRRVVSRCRFGANTEMASSLAADVVQRTCLPSTISFRLLRPRNRRFTRLELPGMELYEVAHARRCFAGALAYGLRHAVVPPLLVQIGHGGEMADDVLRKPRLPQAFAPRREWDVAISDGPAERLGENARIVVQIGGFRPRQVVDLSDMGCRVVEDNSYLTRHIDRRDRRGLAAAHRQRQLVGGPHAGGGERKKETLEEDCRPYRDNRQARPGQSLLRQPVQLVLRAVGRLAD